MCGIGVVSLIDMILNPLACKALKAVSLPEPGPLTSTDRIFIPTSKALAAAASAAGTKEGQGCKADKYADSCAHA